VPPDSVCADAATWVAAAEMADALPRSDVVTRCSVSPMAENAWLKLSDSERGDTRTLTSPAAMRRATRAISRR
jgi:hypothetical protein